MSRRVVVTGMGAITPIGLSVEEFWQSIKEGKIGFGEITKFDTEGYKCHLAAEVKDFDAKQYMDAKTARRMELFCQYAVAAAKEALTDAALDMEKEDPFRVGVIVGSGIGSLQAMEAIKYIIGKGDLLTGRLLTYDALKMEFHTIKLPKDHHCAICGDNPTIHELIDYEQAECDMHK